LFAKESDNEKPIKAFLDKWDIAHAAVDKQSLDGFVSAHPTHHLFDVSDDAATGQQLNHNIIKISGTNLIQQTDRSIARYHVPVILFDHGSGSRAAFAAYWLQVMGFSVSVVYLAEPLNLTAHQIQHTHDTPYLVLSLDQLLLHGDTAGEIFDLRSSQAFSQNHLKGTQWQNISELIALDVQTSEPIALIGDDIAQTIHDAILLDHHGWKIAGVYQWQSAEINSSQLQVGTLETPVDKSALFAERHHGNMQDSRDYLAWEEALPEQIDPSLIKMWKAQLN